MEGLTPLEINRLAQSVSDRLIEMQGQNKAVADTSKIALLVTLSFATELSQERAAHDNTRRLLENKAEQLTQILRDSLAASTSAGE